MALEKNWINGGQITWKCNWNIPIWKNTGCWGKLGESLLSWVSGGLFPHLTPPLLPIPPQSGPCSLFCHCLFFQLLQAFLISQFPFLLHPQLVLPLLDKFEGLEPAAVLFPQVVPITPVLRPLLRVTSQAIAAPARWVAGQHFPPHLADRWDFASPLFGVYRGSVSLSTVST